MEWLETKTAFWTERSGVGVANPPEKWCLRLGISGVVFLLQQGHGVDRVVAGNVAMNNAVPQALGRFFLQRFRITIHYPIDRAIANRVCAYVDSRTMNQLHHLPVHRWLYVRVTRIASIRLLRLGKPRIVNPRRAAASAAVHIQFDSAGEQRPIS